MPPFGYRNIFNHHAGIGRTGGIVLGAAIGLSVIDRLTDRPRSSERPPERKDSRDAGRPRVNDPGYDPRYDPRNAGRLPQTTSATAAPTSTTPISTIRTADIPPVVAPSATVAAPAPNSTVRLPPINFTPGTAAIVTETTTPPVTAIPASQPTAAPFDLTRLPSGTPVTTKLLNQISLEVAEGKIQSRMIGQGTDAREVYFKDGKVIGGLSRNEQGQTSEFITRDHVDSQLGAGKTVASIETGLQAVSGVSLASAATVALVAASNPAPSPVTPRLTGPPGV